MSNENKEEVIYREYSQSEKIAINYGLGDRLKTVVLAMDEYLLEKDKEVAYFKSEYESIKITLEHYERDIKAKDTQLSEFTNQILEQNKEIEELKKDVESNKKSSTHWQVAANELMDFVKELEQEIQHLKSQPDSKGGEDIAISK